MTEEHSETQGISEHKHCLAASIRAKSAAKFCGYKVGESCFTLMSLFRVIIETLNSAVTGCDKRDVMMSCNLHKILCWI